MRTEFYSLEVEKGFTEEHREYTKARLQVLKGGNADLQFNEHPDGFSYPQITDFLLQNLQPQGSRSAFWG
jgi:hypothetical protein